MFLRLNLNKNDLNFVVNEICKKQLKVNSPLIWIEKDLLFDENDESDENMGKFLAIWVKNNSILKVCDDDSGKIYKIIIQQNEQFKVNQYEIEFKNESEEKNKEITEKNNDNGENKNNNLNEDFLMIEDNNSLVLNNKESSKNEYIKNTIINSINLIENNNIIILEDDKSEILNSTSLRKKRKHEFDLEEFK